MNASEKILQSWHANADAWIATIEGNDLESRVLATNDAIVTAVTALQPQRVIDIGCGEGWLCRALRSRGIEAWGVDAVLQLVKKAIEKDGPYYTTATYQELASGLHQLPLPFDVAVINFALLDEEDTAHIIHALPNLLRPTGYVVIQTLHSSVVDAGTPSGWQRGSWNGMKQDFVQPYQWYYRSTADWYQLFESAGFCCIHMQEPAHPHSGKPLSIIFVLQVAQA